MRIMPLNFTAQAAVIGQKQAVCQHAINEEPNGRVEAQVQIKDINKDALYKLEASKCLDNAKNTIEEALICGKRAVQEAKEIQQNVEEMSFRVKQYYNDKTRINTKDRTVHTMPEGVLEYDGDVLVRSSEFNSFGDLVCITEYQKDMNTYYDFFNGELTSYTKMHKTNRMLDGKVLQNLTFKDGKLARIQEDAYFSNGIECIDKKLEFKDGKLINYQEGIVNGSRFSLNHEIKKAVSFLDDEKPKQYIEGDNVYCGCHRHNSSIDFKYSDNCSRIIPVYYLKRMMVGPETTKSSIVLLYDTATNLWNKKNGF